MGKPTAKKKKTPPKQSDGKSKQCKGSDRPTKSFDEDTAMFISMSHEIKEEGNRLFQNRDHEGAMLKYENALKLLPRNHIDGSYLHSNIAACFMQIGLGAYPQAIRECSLALEVSPKYSKALMKRARCYEALNKHNFALRDVNNVLRFEPNNIMALEIADRVKKMILENGDGDGDGDGCDILVPESPLQKSRKKKKKKKKKSNRMDEAKVEDKLIVGDMSVNVVKEDRMLTPSIVNGSIVKENNEVVTKTVKLVFGEDIRWAQLPLNCSIQLVRDIVLDRFPCLKSILIKYKDAEGDLVTVTTTEELRLAEDCVDDAQGTFRLHISAVNPSEEPDYGGGINVYGKQLLHKNFADALAVESVGNCTEIKSLVCVDDWIVYFAQLFKNHVGIDSDSYLNLHEIGIKLYSEAMEDICTCEDAQELFEIAGFKFQEMAAVALFNWGNVHMSRARKQVCFTEEDLAKSMIKSAFEWAKKEYENAKTRYEDALKIKEDFYEALLALGQQQFEQAKLCWYYAIANKDELEGRHFSEVLELYNKAEDSMERGMQKWEEMEEQRLNGLSKSDKQKIKLQKKGLDCLLNEPSVDESTEQAANMKSQIYLLWGSLLYERSVVEYKMGLPVWEESLEVSIEMFELAGASHTDMAVMLKNHCSNGTASNGIGFKIDEIVQAWNEMYDAKRLQSGIPSFRLEPLFRRRVPKLHDTLEHF